MILFCVPQPSILFLQQPLKLMIMEIVNIEASTFMEMNNILFKIEKQMKGLNFSKPELSEWLDKDRKVYYKKEDILNYMRNNLKTHINNENGTDGIE